MLRDSKGDFGTHTHSSHVSIKQGSKLRQHRSESVHLVCWIQHDCLYKSCFVLLAASPSLVVELTRWVRILRQTAQDIAQRAVPLSTNALISEENDENNDGIDDEESFRPLGYVRKGRYRLVSAFGSHQRLSGVCLDPDTHSSGFTLLWSLLLLHRISPRHT